jgi:hypothetical protein
VQHIEDEGGDEDLHRTAAGKVGGEGEQCREVAVAGVPDMVDGTAEEPGESDGGVGEPEQCGEHRVDGEGADATVRGDPAGGRVGTAEASGGRGGAGRVVPGDVLRPPAGGPTGVLRRGAGTVGE